MVGAGETDSSNSENGIASKVMKIKQKYLAKALRLSRFPENSMIVPFRTPNVAAVEVEKSHARRLGGCRLRCTSLHDLKYSIEYLSRICSG